MFFVTVGTHEQSFSRLIKKIDELVRDGIIDDEVIIQTGYTDYNPQYCKHSKMFGFDEMNELAKKCDVMITHGGPASIFLAQQYGKKPIVVPRESKYGEHVDDHQVLFTKRLYNNNKIILVREMDNIEEAIEISQQNKEFMFQSKTNLFVQKIEELAIEVLK